MLTISGQKNSDLMHKDSLRLFSDLKIHRNSWKKTLKEIIEMVKEKELNINLSIKLQTGNIIYFKID